MPFTETITIINNSGKVISTGKHLFGIFKDAKNAYKEKKAVLESERLLRRSNTTSTYEGTRGLPQPTQEEEQYYYQAYGNSLVDEDRDHGGRYDDDLRSRASSQRSSRSHRSHRSRANTERTKYRPALTAGNLEALSEVSGATPSRALTTVQPGYRPPYAETVSKSMVLSRPDLARIPPTRGGSSVFRGSLEATPTRHPYGEEIIEYHQSESPFPRTHSEPSFVHHYEQQLRQRHSQPPSPPDSDAGSGKDGKKGIDMDLAYGPLPPDLRDRVDLDPVQEPDSENQAQDLVSKIEGLLDEAQCVHHTATAIITTLQDSPERAAAVALALAELSSLLGKAGPTLAGLIKAGSPAVFGLLASPQFLIAAGVAVGVTVVMFGGWKIVKKIREQQTLEGEKISMEMGKMRIQEEAQQQAQYVPPPPAGLDMGPIPEHDFGYQRDQYYGNGNGTRAATEVSHDEALVLDEVEELSTIESWRRGIVPMGENESVDGELITPGADRDIRERFMASQMDFADDITVTADDSVSRAGGKRRRHKHRSGATEVSGSGTRMSRSQGHDKKRGSRLKEEIRTEVSAKSSSSRKSRRRSEDDEDTKSRHSSHSHRSDRSHRSHRSERSESHRSERPRSRAPSRLAIEDGRKEKDNTLQSILGGSKEGSSAGSGSGREKEKKTANMLKTLFKKKKEREERGGSKLALEMV